MDSREALQCRALLSFPGKNGTKRNTPRSQPAQRSAEHLEALLGNETSHRANDRRLSSAARWQRWWHIDHAGYVIKAGFRHTLALRIAPEVQGRGEHRRSAAGRHLIV